MLNNPVVFFDITVGAEPAGRLKLELFADICPRTAENFKKFCTGETRNAQGVPQGYKGCSFHRVISGFMVQSGDFINNNGSGSTCIYGTQYFNDENFTLKHDSFGLLAMANSGPNTNGCQFYITCADKIPHLDGKHVVFGRVVDEAGRRIVSKIANLPVMDNNVPRVKAVITGKCFSCCVYVVECGEL